MKRYIGNRLLQLIPVLFGVTVIAFGVTHFIPGNPAEVILGQQATPAAVAQLTHQMGLDQPLYEQYFRYIWQLLQGNLGTSIVTGKPVAVEMFPHLAATAELAVFALFFAIVVGINVGILTAAKRNTWADYVPMIIALVGVSMPIFWLGLLAQWVFGVQLGWFPVLGRVDATANIHVITGFYGIDTLLAGNLTQFWDVVRHLVVPGVVLGTIPMAVIARMTRSSMLDVMSSEYVRTAQSKGLSAGLVLYKHALRNALGPIITVIGIQVGSLLGGAILTETIFGWPGVGSYIYDAIGNRDYPVIQSGVLIIALIFILVNLITDLTYRFVDRRITF